MCGGGDRGVDVLDQLDLRFLEEAVQLLDVGLVEVELGHRPGDLRVREHADLQGGVANLPRTRPQRDSPRRAAARDSSSSAAAPPRKRDSSAPGARSKAGRSARSTRTNAKASRATAKTAQAAPRRRAAAAA